MLRQGLATSPIACNSDMVRSDGLNLREGKFRLDIRKNVLSEIAERHWHKLPRELGESLSLGVSNKHGDVALKDMVSGHGGDGLMVGLGDFRGLFQP